MPIINSLRALLKLGRRETDAWPYVPGKYKVVDPTAPIVVVLADAEALAEDLAQLAARGLCMVAPHCRNATEAEKLVRNVAANLSIQYVVLAGGNGTKQPAIQALAATLRGRESDDDDTASIAGSLATKLTDVDLDSVRTQIKAVDMLGCSDIDRIIAKVSELASDAIRPNTGFRAPARDGSGGIERVIAATQISYETKVDKAGGYAIRVERGQLVVEHYNSKHELLRVIEGKTARDLCITLIRNGWVSKLDHAAYLGRELTLAEAALRTGRPYVQDAEPYIVGPSKQEETRH